MTEHTNKWREIFTKIIEDNGYYEFGKVNFYNLTSILEDLYVENAELKERIEKLEKWKDRFIYVNAAVVGLLFAVLINPVFTEAVYSEATTALAILSLFICIALKRSPLELVIVMMGAAYICHLLEWI